jgi:hypothetical protein
MGVILASAGLLGRMFERPYWQMLLVGLTFGAFTLGLAHGNMSPLLLVGLLLLARALSSRGRTSSWRLLPLALVAATKLFPLGWMMIPLLGRRWDVLKRTAALVGVHSRMCSALRLSYADRGLPGRPAGRRYSSYCS